MYNKFRDILTAGILDNCPEVSMDMLKSILQQVDVAAAGFDFAEKTTDLIPYDNQTPQLLKLYIAAKTVEGQSKGTLQNALYICRAFFGMIQKPIEQVTANDIRVFLYNWQEEHGVSPVTMDKYRVTLSSFFHWCVAEEYLPKDPTLTIKPLKVEKKQRESLSQMELEYLRKACKTLRERALVEFLYSTGCRISEVSNVKREDVNLITGEVHLFGKGKKHRTSYINAKCYVALTEYLNARSDNCEYLFTTERRPHRQITPCAAREAFERIADRSGLEKTITPHIIRHTTATQAVQHGMPIEQVQKLLGHENIATTMIYVETSEIGIQLSHRKAVV